MNFDLSAQGTGHETRLWIPYPVSDRFQNISGIDISGNYDHFGIYTDRKFGRPMLYAQWNRNTAGRNLHFSFHVDRKERQDLNLPDREPCWTPLPDCMFLKPATLVPVDGRVRLLADKITAGRNSVRQKISAIYDWLVSNMARKPESPYCGDGNVAALIDERRGNCVDIHSVFVALARSAGVPAREVFGLRLGKMDRGTVNITKWEHCWAEFYMPGYGWVVTDPADVLKKMLVEKLPADSEKAGKYRRYFRYSVDPYRVRFGSGRDIMLNPEQFGPPINYLMYPYAEIDGTPVDPVNARKFQYNFTFTPDGPLLRSH